MLAGALVVPTALCAGAGLVPVQAVTARVVDATNDNRTLFTRHPPFAWQRTPRDGPSRAGGEPPGGLV